MKRALGFMNKALPITYNTYIGGVASSISTAVLLATKLGISVGNISNFTVVGSDIKCKITGIYSIPNNAFSNVSGTMCTYYIDSDYLVTYMYENVFYLNSSASGVADFKNLITIESDVFRGTSFTKFLLENAINIGNNCFKDNTISDVFYIPNCTILGSSALNNDVFGVCNPLAKIYVHPSLATNNAGGEDGDIAYARARGCDINYVTDFTAPSPVTTLATVAIYNTAIKLDFTAPSSTNAIDYYEVYINGIFNKKVYSSTFLINDLTQNTNYNVTLYAVDIFYNKSTVSNTVNFSTLNTGVLSLYEKTISAYHLADGVDAKRGLNGTVGASVTFSTGVNGNGANFNNTTNSNISIPDNSLFSFTNGSGVDKPFSISFFVKLNDLSNQWLVNKRGNTSGTDEWQIMYYFNVLQITLFDANNANQIFCQMTAPLVASTQYHIVATYDGSETNAGLKLYVNGVLQTTTNSTTGTYTGMPSGTAPVVLGKAAWFDGLRLNGQLDEMYFFNTELNAGEITTLQTNYFPF